jgi:hypothetical protein
MFDRWSTFGTFLDCLRATGTSLNEVPLVGLGTVRATVMGFAAGPDSVTGMVAAPGRRSRPGQKPLVAVLPVLKTFIA